MEKIGFIGLGNMGGAICKALIAGGLDVTVFDLNPKALADETYQNKAAIADSTGAVWNACDIVFLSLPSSKQVVPIIEEFIAAGVQGKTIVDTSTSYPQTTRALYARIKAAGGQLVDLAISGAPADAQNGKLMALFGGDAAMHEKLAPIVRCFADRYPNLGESGAGHVAKILFNFVAMSYVNIYAMAFPLAQKLGLDMDQVYELLLSTGMGCGTMQFYVPKMIHQTYEMAFALELAHKDLSYCRSLFEEFQVPAFLLDGELAMLRTAIRDGKGKMDYSACIGTMFEFFEGK
ncbi:NAD(P)-dependent oxidoreductase [Butyricicoccus faecihominis]|uniref:NAD(P)-dependent oxidoreductase n=1 Tax=Butyricicoccus faecihominis TaxID=1712515 RepID=UPI002479C4F3|nr:NAD(P)-dependent oxidoreductase [Butyricicoccus faecihominis]MCQ5131400.1 NAD(P)-dependent oxidoreductase [Butyricicoccus faecihominis]